MDLWIRSQNGIILTSNPKMQIIEECGKYRILEIMSYEHKLFLGEYNSIERALEVLDEIERILIGKKLIELKTNLSPFSMNQLKRETGAQAIVETPFYKILNSTNNIIYEMPNE